MTGTRLGTRLRTCNHPRTRVIRVAVALSLSGLLLGCASLGAPKPAGADAPFVRVENAAFYIGDRRYPFVGVNFWYGAYLGSPDPALGNRPRLTRELDKLASMGVTNLRILGASEASPLRDAISPAISDRGKVIRPDLLRGLDFLLAEMAKREMKAVIYLNNFWEWSGGMATYLSWVGERPIVDPSDPTTPWPAFALYTAQFYGNEPANRLFQAYLKRLLTRINTVNGRAYRNDPTIMAWQLANEPRPGHLSEPHRFLPAFFQWLEHTAAYIEHRAPRQLVSIGSEGTMGCLQSTACVKRAHRIAGIDYMTVHLWLKNWGWYDATRAKQTFAPALTEADEYLTRHIALARELELPLVLEEFGLERDAGAYDRDASTQYRDRFLRHIYQRVEASIATSGPLVGSNLWSWGGFGRAQHADYRWRAGDRSFVGDPPQEAQGLNSVFASDRSTVEVIRQHARAIQRASAGGAAQP